MKIIFSFLFFYSNLFKLTSIFDGLVIKLMPKLIVRGRGEVKSRVLRSVRKKFEITLERKAYLGCQDAKHIYPT